MPSPAGPDTAPLPTVVTVDLWADLGCPWCYVGTRRLALAVAREPGGTVLQRWRAHPSSLRDGADHAVEGGDPDARLVAAGREVGIRFDPDRLSVVRDTRLAQRAVLLYHGEARQRAVVAALCAAHYEDGLDLGQVAVVADVAAHAAGQPTQEVRDRLDSGDGADRLRIDAREATTLGIRTVPTYVLDGRIAVRGDHQPATLRAMIVEARRLASVGSGPA